MRSLHGSRKPNHHRPKERRGVGEIGSQKEQTAGAKAGATGVNKKRADEMVRDFNSEDWTRV